MHGLMHANSMLTYFAADAHIFNDSLEMLIKKGTKMKKSALFAFHSIINSKVYEPSYVQYVRIKPILKKSYSTKVHKYLSN
jgi:hypothetical protein